MAKYYLESDKGRWPLAIATDEEAMKLADENYDDDDADRTSTPLIVKVAEGEPEYLLIPGGPADEDYTWVPKDI